MSSEHELHIDSLVLHAPGDGDQRFGDVVVPIHLTTTFRQDAPGHPPVYDYSRGGNPTRQVLEDHIALLEGGVAGYAFGSGMAAITAVLSLFEPGDEILVPNNIYGGTYRVLERYFKRYGLGYAFVDVSSPTAVAAAFSPATKALLFETPTNPLLSIADIAALSAVAHAHGALVIVDNTFLTPYLQRPLALGADIVVHSATKYLGGHSDVLAGLVVTDDRDLAQRIHFIQYSTGGVLPPFDSYLLQRGIKTLGLRVERQSASAATLAPWLAAHKGVEQVFYPGLPEHPGSEVHARQASGGGGLISFTLEKGLDIRAFLKALRLITLAESLGAVESLICHPATMTHASIPAPLRAEMGIGEQLLRLSVGIEHVEDLRTDLERAFGAIGL